jgi:divalent metal cation (Fe/Co/Zn/Cd) transporter
MENSLSKKSLRLSYISIGYTILESIFSIGGGLSFNSISLLSFGLDSLIETLSSSIVIWRFKKGEGLSKEADHELEHKATWLIAYSFFVIAIYTAYESIRKIYFHETPRQSLLGVVVAILSIIVMTIMFQNKKNLAKEMGSMSVEADSKQTLVCAMMSVVLLISLGLNYFYGLWWTDGVGGLIISIFLLREGWQSYKEQKVCLC